MTNRNIGSNLQHPTSTSSTTTSIGWRLSALSLATVLLLSACDGKTTAAKASDQPSPETATGTTPATSPAPAEPVVASYTPPTAQVLYQMVAPIALYPDKLVAQILAGATYPDQISAAESWVGQNPGMQKTAMLNAVNTQAWDPSVKSLTEFPNVLGQLAANIPWTTALGKAYYNDPSDVMNAVQVMRSRAYQSGTLKTSRQLKVNVGAQASAAGYTPSSAVPASVRDTLIAPPAQLIQIEPAQANTVYVPRYDPQAVYGEPMPAYHGYQYVTAPPLPPVMGAATPVVTGLLGFGAGVLLADSMNSHPWGWNSWNVHWGEPGAHWRTGNPLPPMQARPAVVYNNQTYVSRSHTVVNNIRRTEDVHVTNVYEGSAGPMHNAGGQAQAQLPVAGPDHGGSHASAALAAAAAGTALAAGAVHAGRQNPVNAAVPPPSAAASVTVDSRRQPSLQMPMPMNPAMTAEHGRAGNTAGNAPALPPVMAPAHAANGIREAGNPQRLAQNPGQMQTRPAPLPNEREQAQQRAQLQHTQADMQAQQHMAQQQQQQAQVQAQMQAKQHQAEMNAQAQQQARQQQMHQQEQQQQQQHTAQMQAQQQAQQQAQAKAQEAQMREQQAQQQQQHTAQMRAQQQAQQQQQQRAAQQPQAQQHAQAAHSQPREREAPKRREHE